MFEARTSLRLLLSVFVLALLVRSGWLLGMIAAHDAESAWHLTPDSSRYLCIARHLLGQPYEGPALHDLQRPVYGHGAGALVWSGPGYGAFVAVCVTLLGDSPWAVLGAQTLLSSLNCAGICLLSVMLGLPRRVAVLAGVIAALSLTSISLSCMVLTETLTVTLHLAALVCLVHGWRHGGARWFLAAGALAGLGGLVRSVLQYWPVVMVALAMVLPRQWLGAGRRSAVLGGGVAAAVALAVMGAWMTRNHVRHGVWTLSETGPMAARFWLGARAVAALDPERSPRDVRRGWLEDERRVDGAGGADVATYHRRDRSALGALLRSHPLPLARRLCRNVLENATAGNELHAAQLPQLAGSRPALSRAYATSNALAFAAVLLAAVGLLLAPRSRPAGWILAATTAYFLFMSGFSCWQGSRLNFAGHVTWTVLLAVACERVLAAVRALAGRPLARPASA